MKPVRVLPFLALGLVCSQAQVYTPPPAAPAGEALPAADVANRPAAANADSPFGQEIPLLDPSAETVTVAGITIPLGDNRLIRARFERYLNQAPEDDEETIAYRETIGTILQTLSPLRPGGPDLYSAFTLLPSAAAYPGDANICSTLAEAVYMAMLANRDVRGIERLNASIEREKQELIREGDWRNRHDRQNDLNATRETRAQNREGRGQRRQQGAAAAAGADLRQQDILRRITEIEALKVANQTRTEVQTLRTKAQFQVNMLQWFLQRRYEHVVMAARFYNQVWTDGDTTLHIDEGSDVARLFSDSVGVSPTVSSLDSFANEAIREVEKFVEAFELLLERGEMHSASQRLMEAFMLGEYLAPVATLELEKKRRVADYVRDLHELYGAMQARDYTRARELVTALRAAARDFPASRAESMISAHTLASDLAIEEARAHLMAGERDQVAGKIQAATEMWPTNPRLDEFRNLVSNSSAVIQARNDFDRLLSESNYREIARRQYEFAPAIQGDPVREDAFSQILTNLTKIELALGRAAEFSRMGQSYAAYEQLAELREEFPDDPNLGRQIEVLAPRVADFTLALDRARNLEERRNPRQTGSALAWYLKARNIFPQSKFAEEGIQRMLDIVLDEQDPDARP